MGTGHPRVILRWQTESESNTFGYYVYRAATPDGEFIYINSQNPVHAAGNSSIPLKYAFFDLTVELGKTYYYQLKSQDLDGSNEWIVGAEKPILGLAKALKETEVNEIREKGQSYREDGN